MRHWNHKWDDIQCRPWKHLLWRYQWKSNAVKWGKSKHNSSKTSTTIANSWFPIANMNSFLYRSATPLYALHASSSSVWSNNDSYLSYLWINACVVTTHSGGSPCHLGRIPVAWSLAAGRLGAFLDTQTLKKNPSGHPFFLVWNF